MRVFLKNISGQLKQFSKSLDKKSILIDQPWALIDEEFEIQKLIFKKDGELIMSKNGNVTTGSWEYLPTANALLIDRGDDKILCQEEFIDEGVLILRLDGTDNKFFALANENIIPDLQVENYLENLKREKFRIRSFPLYENQLLEVFESYATNSSQLQTDRGNKVLIDGKSPKDGEYALKDSDKMLQIKEGRIKRLITTYEYQTKDGYSIFVEQDYSISFYYNKGDRVFKDPERTIPADDGVYKLGLFRKIRVKNGRVV